MTCLIPSACVFCGHYHQRRNEQTDELPSCDAFAAIPDEIFMGQFDHAHAFPGDQGVRFRLIEAERREFMELNEIRRELGLLVYREPEPRGLRRLCRVGPKKPEKKPQDTDNTRHQLTPHAGVGVASAGVSKVPDDPRGAAATGIDPAESVVDHLVPRAV